jgi:RIO kinase 1
MLHLATGIRRTVRQPTPRRPHVQDTLLFDDFLGEGLVTEILRPIRSGKEADVYLCRATPHMTGGVDLVAAKMLRPRHQRRFRNDAIYLEGRYRKRTHEVKAMEAKHRVGRELAHGAWIEHEWATLRALHAAGADVPRPIARSSVGLLMTHVGDEDVSASQLREVRLGRDEATGALERLLRNVGILLLHNVIHGDLSAYNVLWWEGTPTIIDFPQAIDPRFNANAPELLARDVANVCTYFRRLGVERDAARIASDLWTGFEFADLWVEPP